MGHQTSEKALHVEASRRPTLRAALARHLVADAPPDYEQEMAKIPRVRPWVAAVVIGGAVVVLWGAIVVVARLALRISS